MIYIYSLVIVTLICLFTINRIYNKKYQQTKLTLDSLQNSMLISGCNGSGVIEFCENLTNGKYKLIQIDSLGMQQEAHYQNLYNQILNHLDEHPHLPMIINHSDILFKKKTIAKQLLLKINKSNHIVIFRTQECSGCFYREFSGFFNHMFLGITFLRDDYLFSLRNDLLPGTVIGPNSLVYKS